MLLLNLGTVEHTLQCWMGDIGERQDDSGPSPAHNVTLSALLPTSPSSTSAETDTARMAAKEPCMFFDYAIGPIQFQLAGAGVTGNGALQLGIFELRTASTG